MEMSLRARGGSRTGVGRERRIGREGRRRKQEGIVPKKRKGIPSLIDVSRTDRVQGTRSYIAGHIRRVITLYYQTNSERRRDLLTSSRAFRDHAETASLRPSQLLSFNHVDQSLQSTCHRVHPTPIPLSLTTTTLTLSLTRFLTASSAIPSPSKPGAVKALPLNSLVRSARP
jgi:hypothetical protein